MKKIYILLLVLCVSIVIAYTSAGNTEENSTINSSCLDNELINNGQDIKLIEMSGLIPEFTMRDLVCDSEVIIKGSVNVNLNSKWSNKDNVRGKNIRNIIQTDVLIDIDKIYKGNPYNDRQIAVRLDKGQIGNTVFKSEGFPDFKEDEEVILFLSIDDSDVANPNENYYVLTGMEQGKFTKSEIDNTYTSREKEIKLDKLDSIINENLQKEKKNPRENFTEEEINKNNEELFGQ